MSRDHQCLRLQCARECHHWRAQWQNAVFSDESCLKMSYNDGRIRVRRFTGERNLKACILQRHKRPMPSVMVWGAIAYNMRSCLLCIEGNLNSNHYIREVLQPEMLPLLQTTPHAIFEQDNALPHVARSGRAFFKRHGYQLLPWPAHSPDILPIEHVWDMVGWRLNLQCPPAPVLDALWTHI